MTEPFNIKRMRRRRQAFEFLFLLAVAGASFVAYKLVSGQAMPWQ
jgi:hypothetical protein